MVFFSCAQVKNKMVDILCDMSSLAKSPDNMGMAAAAFADLFDPSSVLPDENSTVSKFKLYKSIAR